MAKRKIYETRLGNRRVSCYFNPALAEFSARLYIGGRLYAPADYFTSERADCLDTAAAMVRDPAEAEPARLAKPRPAGGAYASAERLAMVRDILIERHGDHMVASTLFAKAFPSIYRAIASGAEPVAVARSCDHIEFAGSDGYETLTGD